MPSVNIHTVRNQIFTTVKNSSSEQNQKPVKTAVTAQGGSYINFPEDIVTLSTSSSITQSSSKDIQPSTPVSNPERNTLLKTSSGRTGFFTYA
jgi:hypothetical protein